MICLQGITFLLEQALLSLAGRAHACQAQFWVSKRSSKITWYFRTYEWFFSPIKRHLFICIECFVTITYKNNMQYISCLFLRKWSISNIHINFDKLYMCIVLVFYDILTLWHCCYFTLDIPVLNGIDIRSFSESWQRQGKAQMHLVKRNICEKTFFDVIYVLIGNLCNIDILWFLWRIFTIESVA